jgi:hypothetical protein
MTQTPVNTPAAAAAWQDYRSTQIWVKYPDLGAHSTPPQLRSGARYTGALFDVRDISMPNLVVELCARTRAL